MFNRLGHSLLLMAILPTLVLADPSCTPLVDKKLIYQLTLTVPATFCKSRHTDPSCRRFPKSTLIQLHGLWPNYVDHTFPEGSCDAQECPMGNGGSFCGDYYSPPDLYDSQVWLNESGFMAGVERCLERHEWTKHGVCSPMKDNAVKYFKTALDETKRIAMGLNPQPDLPISQSDLNQVIKAKLPDLDGAFRFRCNGSRVLEISVSYEWGDTPGKAIKDTSQNNIFKGCSERVIFPSRP